ncbi:MAG: peptide ABC transporter ATP-binding protein [Candidatus Hydrogenedentota bacterium]
MIKLENVRRKLGPGVEFFCERFQAEDGEQVALWGPSGCGKSTMLNLISGLLKPDDGVIVVDSVEIQKLSAGQLDRFRGERYGFVFQTFNLLAPFTSAQNVLLGMFFSDTIPSKEWKERAAAMLKRVGLEHRIHSRPGTLSVGERQRVAIARALVNDPKIIVADEPTGSLDPKTSASVMDLLLELCGEEKKTLILVTHAMDLAERLPNQFDCHGLIKEDVS